MMFEIGSIVVHPTAGLVEINNIAEVDYGGEKLKCYVFEKKGVIFSVPVEGAEGLGLRSLIGSDEVDEIWNILRAKVELEIEESLRRMRDIFSESLNGDIRKAAAIIRDLRRMAEARERRGLGLPENYNKLLSGAENMLIEEISYVQGVDKKKVRQRLKSLFKR
jgi:CarD family transcriptional regulator